ncbi:MAG TPA: hypothetical protein VG122_10785, partial [Gemmata sp.]|nr:hypothetical protein [Gemmata sp.]
MPHSPSLFGSLVWWELVRLARRRQASRGRVLLLYLLLLTIVLFAVWWSSPNSPSRLFCGTPETLSLGKAAEDRRSAAYFAESLALILLEAQLLFVAILTPLYAALAVSEEKDRQTLSLLLTTELTEREIVWSKTLARVVFVLSAVTAGIPVLMLVLLFGGVSLELIVSGYALIIGTTILSASIGVSAACRCLDTRTALVRTYAHAAVLIGGLPFVVLAYEFGGEGPYRMKLDTSALRLGVGFGFAFIQVAIGLALLFRATNKLRTHGPTAGAAAPTAYPEPPRGRPTPVLVGPRVVEPRPLPPLDDADPVLWKERHAAHTMQLPILDTLARWLGVIMAIIAAVLFIVGACQL